MADRAAFDVAEAHRLAQEIKNLVEFRLRPEGQDGVRLQILTAAHQLLHVLGATDAEEPCDTHGWPGCKVCADREREGQWPDGHRKEPRRA